MKNNNVLSIVISFALSICICVTSSGQDKTRELLVKTNKLKSSITRSLARKKYEDANKELLELTEAVKELKEANGAKPSSIVVRLEKFIDQSSKKIKPHLSSQPGSNDPSTTTSPGGVSFTKDVAPILVRNCTRCHGNNNPRSGFNLSTFGGMLKGGDQGEDVLPGKPADSLMLLMLKGEEEPRMPPGNRALRADLIGTIEKWISQGARFDGGPQFNQETQLQQIVPSANEQLLAKMAAMSVSELQDLHTKLADRHWTLSNPSKKPASSETDNFILRGSVPEDTLKTVGETAEESLKMLSKALARPKSKGDVWRGKLAIHVFGSRYEYGELGMMVERRQLPPEAAGHYFGTPQIQYIAFVASNETTESKLKGIVTEQLAKAYLSTAFGSLPNWFTTGMGRAYGSKFDAKSETTRRWQSEALRALNYPAEALAVVLEGKSGPADALGYSMMQFILSQRQLARSIPDFAEQLAKGKKPKDAFESVFKMNKQVFAVNWKNYAAKTYR